MKILTRLTATLGAGTERAVARFENHDAIAAAAVRGAREAVATARVRHARLVRDGEKRRTRLAALIDEELRWVERARQSAATDEDNALACLERRRATRARIDDARDALEEHERLERETTARLATLERRLAEISRRRDALRSRESIARAGEVLDTLGRDDGEGLEDVFERWEVRIAERVPLDADLSDVHHDAAFASRPGEDALARRYANSERDASLRAELATLIDRRPGNAGPDHGADPGADEIATGATATPEDPGSVAASPVRTAPDAESRHD